MLVSGLDWVNPWCDADPENETELWYTTGDAGGVELADEGEDDDEEDVDEERDPVEGTFLLFLFEERVMLPDELWAGILGTAELTPRWLSTWSSSYQVLVKLRACIHLTMLSSDLLPK